MPRLYALFVGINEYQSPDVPDLRGAVADVLALAAVFEKRTAPSAFKPLVLLDGEATRDAIIDNGFRKHLGQAGSDDVALFYYCGHGSQERCPEVWHDIEPKKLNETILSCDARTQRDHAGQSARIYDIADKELSMLIHEIAERGAEVVIITDSCNSGGNTREVALDGEQRIRARHTAEEKRPPRQVSQYLPAVQERFTSERLQAEGAPTPRHVALAACQSSEKAIEISGATGARGIFSHTLEDALDKLGPSATYIDLVNAVRLRVKDRLMPESLVQVPDLYVSGGASVAQLFLAGQIGRVDIKVRANSAGEWWMTYGAIDGLPDVVSGGETSVAIYPVGAFDNGGAVEPLATGVVVAVQHDAAQLSIDSSAKPLDLQNEYIVRITRLGSPALDVIVDVPANADASVLATAQDIRKRLSSEHPMIALTDKPTRAAVIRAKVSGDEVHLCDASGAPFPGLTYAPNAVGLNQLGKDVDHLARWHRTRDLRPKGSALNDLARIDILPVGEKVAGVEPVFSPDTPPFPVADGTVTLRYTAASGARVKVRVTNTHAAPLYIAVVQLQDDLSASLSYYGSVPAMSSAYFDGGKAWRFKVPEWKGDGDSSLSIFKSIVATNPFNPERWSLPPLIGASGTSSRGGGADVDDEVVALWGTSSMRVKTVR